jgi:hypothetical protein
MVSIPIRFKTSTILIPVFFLFLRFSYPTFQRRPYFSYGATKGILISIPVVSISVGFKTSTILIPVFFLFVHFSYPTFQRGPKANFSYAAIQVQKQIPQLLRDAEMSYFK